MLKNGIKLISRQTSNLGIFNRLICRNFITLSRYNNFTAINNNIFCIQMSLNFFQKQNMCTNEKPKKLKNDGYELFLK